MTMYKKTPLRLRGYFTDLLTKLYRSVINFWERKHEHVFQIRQLSEHLHLF